MTRSCMGVLLLSLPECLLGLLQLLDAQGLAQLRRCGRVGNCHGSTLAHAMRVAELRAAILELLQATKFPFVHAAYVLGLNGSHYSLDTATDRHYGIPLRLPRLLCELFRLEVPNTDFTTIRIQKFASSVNFNGSHRTLPVNLHTPFFDAEDTSATPPSHDVNRDAKGVPASALCLTEGCKGGFGELCENLEGDSDEGHHRWRRFVQPAAGSSAPRWIQFPMDTWLRWYWPTSGDYYVIIATCEPADFIRGLRTRQHRQMLKLGFRLPEPWNELNKEDADEDECHERVPEGERRSPRRLSSARVIAAKRLLGLQAVVIPTIQEIEEAYDNAVRQANESAAGQAGTREGNRCGRFGWDIAQLSWASRVLRDAHHAAQEASTQGNPPPWIQEQVSQEPISIAAPAQLLPLPAPGA
ncbi:unnamed protein product [Symbiodinium natans]|uniref:Uncharacterized protein n=1 Tax=Symbiodinium natans TaxID=878477 RepID=A0A812PCJ4_9DINO|nr:unnamed protein product [Symbiodinium natans]